MANTNTSTAPPVSVKAFEIAFIVALILGSYNLWSFFNSSRYQALCGASFWELNRSELESCLDQKKELDK